MMKIIIFLVVLLALISCNENKAEVNSEYKFIEFVDYTLLKSFPPKISLRFSIACNEELIKVVKYESMDKKTGEYKIAIGGIVKVDQSKKCKDKPKLTTISGGEAGIGANSEIIKITK